MWFFVENKSLCNLNLETLKEIVMLECLMDWNELTEAILGFFCLQSSSTALRTLRLNKLNGNWVKGISNNYTPVATSEYTDAITK